MATTREQRRRDSERRILSAARVLFAARGFERATIRAIAAEARVDPGLVMQYFGSKRALFERAIAPGPDEGDAGEPGELTDSLLASLGVKLGGLPDTSLAVLRSMLTDPESGARACAGLNAQVERIHAGIGGEDAELRAALVVCTMLGVTIGHRLLELDGLRDATADEIAALLRPCIDSLLGDGRPRTDDDGDVLARPAGD